MDNIVNGFSKSVAKINLKASNLLEENKLKTYISTLQNEIQSLKLEIGNKVYEQWKAGGVDNNTLTPMLSEIKAKEATIVEQEERIKELELQEKQILGETQTPVSSQNVGNKKVCSNCGAENAAMNRFCEKCGTPLQ